MSCPPDPPTFRLLDALVGWDESDVQGIVGLDDTGGLTLQPLASGLSSEAISVAIPPAYLAKACDPCRWYQVSCCPPQSRLLLLDSCAPGWVPVWNNRCAPDVLQCAGAIAVYRDLIAIADHGAGRVWVWRRGGGELAFAIAVANPGPLAWSRQLGLLVVDADALRLRRFDTSGAERTSSTRLPGTTERIAIDRQHRIWLVTYDNDVFRLWRLDPGESHFSPAALSALIAAFPDTGLRHTRHHHFCLEDMVDGVKRLRCFDCHGRPSSVPHADPPEQYVRRGQLLTLAIDSGIPRCRWHRVRLDADVPAGSKLEFAVSSHEEPTPPPQTPVQILDGDWQGFSSGRPNPADWNAEAADPRDFVISQPPGRYLFVRIRMTGNGHCTPRLRRARIDMPRQTSFDRLPAVFADNPVAIDFGQRFMALFDAAVEDMDRVVEHYPALLDTDGVPQELLPWLGSLFGLAMDSGWTTAQRRAVIHALPDLFRRRGTREGLTRALALLLGANPAIVEAAMSRPWGATGNARLGNVRLFGRAATRFRLGSSGLGTAPVWSVGNPDLDPLVAQSFRFEVMLPLAPTPALRRQVGQVIESQKPAHTIARLRYGAGGLVVGTGIAVGIDTALVAQPAPVLGRAEGARLGRRTVLWSRNRTFGTPIQTGKASAVGIHTLVE